MLLLVYVFQIFFVNDGLVDLEVGEEPGQSLNSGDTFSILPHTAFTITNKVQRGFELRTSSIFRPWLIEPPGGQHSSLLAHWHSEHGSNPGGGEHLSSYFLSHNLTIVVYLIDVTASFFIFKIKSLSMYVNKHH